MFFLIFDWQYLPSCGRLPRGSSDGSAPARSVPTSLLRASLPRLSDAELPWIPCGHEHFPPLGNRDSAWVEPQSYISKGIRRQGVGSFVMSFYVSTICPVVICPYLCTSQKVVVDTQCCAQVWNVKTDTNMPLLVHFWEPEADWQRLMQCRVRFGLGN